MMGVYGMLAIALAMFAFRYVIPAEEKWPKAELSFWSLNIGLAWMVFATLLPLGILLYHSVNDGYYEARSGLYHPARQRADRMAPAARRSDLDPRRHLAVHLDRVAGVAALRSGRTAELPEPSPLYTEVASVSTEERR